MPSPAERGWGEVTSPREVSAVVLSPKATSPRPFPGAEGVTGVQITIDGEAQPLLKGNGDATTGLLRPYDYPGFIQTAQPAYPALPAR